MAEEQNIVDPDLGSLHREPPMEHETLLQRLKDAGYQLLETLPSAHGLIWTLSPEQSQVEFQLVGTDELLRFLNHH